MDLTRAQRLLIKIQAFLDNGNGNGLSRLEKDLMKSYILQLYDVVTSEETLVHQEGQKQKEGPPVKFQKFEAPDLPVPETPKPKTEIPVSYENSKPKMQEVPPEIKVKAPEPEIIAPKPGSRPILIPVTEPVRELVQVPKPVSSPVESTDALAKLFELPNAEEVSGRFSHIPIANIESALGLNERIFTLNDLFGGNRAMFEATCAELNNLSSFAEATALLLSGPAKQFNWASPERMKMAEHFIRIVARRYPKP